MSSPLPLPIIPTFDSSYRCLGLDQTMVLSRTTKERDKMYIGYGNLVREALRWRADLLRDDVQPSLWKHRGVIISKQNKISCLFVLNKLNIVRTGNTGRYTPFFSLPRRANILLTIV